ncbi:Acyl-CoA N-acyltransferase [Cordyceps fumosorosea ARSEF 2679]|uniref:Acyl-CoA N-acyltransferase n=1 Tax=Cordyceps fumosorosea (strain ARSEF 2679) TaxID=1081104 RepID=A0A162JAE9_CORFA|nr:Acyl-CoA N-acyltransferase [Cordyceps fumosorosea ARSEF 2679]OAA66052.1 Acyl-CoA N-acyltransferase [Cordyceps fumosorosea ARSEF 2679]
MPIIIREAREADIPAMAALDVAGYRGSPFRAAMFPASRRVLPGDGDALAWFRLGAQRALASSSSSSRYIVAVDEEEVVGMAIWGAPRPPPAGEGGGGEEKSSAGPPPGLPSYIGYEDVMQANAEIERMLDAQDTLDEATRTLNAIVVDEAHRRRGVGRALVQWGIDKAANSQPAAVWLIATSDGKKLYESMGFGLVGSGLRCGEAQHLMYKNLESSQNRSLACKSPHQHSHMSIYNHRE